MKKQFPLLIVGIDQGIPSKFEDYSFKVHVDTLNLNSLKDFKEGSEIVLTFSTKENMNLEMLDFKKEIDYTGPVGIKCKCIEMIPADDEIVEIKTSYIEEVYLQEIVSNTNSLVASPEKHEINIDIEKNSIHEVMSFIIFLGKKTEILKKKDLKLFKETKSILDLCDSIVHFYYIDNFEKYVYLQIQDLSEKIKNVTNFLLEEGDIEITPEFKLFTKIGSAEQETVSKKEFSSDKYPEQVREALQKEAKKLSRTPSSSLEAQSIQNYIETIQSIPWDKYTTYEHSIKEVIKRIDETHYGLDDVKKHVFQHMVLEDHLGESKGTVLCFLGPPGTGKTSIAKSIAKATERELVKIALGGVSDEAEIRGHRRTYVASKPGRLVDGIIKCRQMNPIILLDEVDKMDSGTKGDPTSALLELLDPEQNNEFIDRFVELPLDLSKCLFICTANYESGIPEALKDRFEFIHFEEYEKNERLEILKKYIVTKVISDYRMEHFDIEIQDSFYDELSKTVSLREIEKKVRKIFKAVLVEFLIEEVDKVVLDETSTAYLNKTKPKIKIGFANAGKNLSK